MYPFQRTVVRTALKSFVCITRYVYGVEEYHKNISNIRQRFLHLLDKGIAKIGKKLNYHYGFLSYLQSCSSASNFLPCPGLPSKVHRDPKTSCIFS